uniref:CCR4-NOT transcription complex subunit 1 n=1 Tax=Heterorhabditis bacteriophora TaxID=37862 RepID=A0A1I7X8P1_HETBA
MMKESSGRSSSVSSSGRAPVTTAYSINDPRGFTRAVPTPSFPNNAAASFNPLLNIQQSVAQQVAGNNPTGLGAMFGGSAFGGSQDLLKASQPAASQQFGSNPMTLSPSTQMMRSTVPQPPQRQVCVNSSNSGWQLAGAGQQRPAGPPTPSQQMDFRPQLPPTGSQSDFSAAARPTPISDDLSQLTFTEDIQDEANSYFEQIYSPTGQLTVSDLISRLKGFKNSQNIRDQKVLACVVKNLFEEYRFFHEYPERELRTTAEVYGGIIREGIISNLHFATAVRKVIESLQSEYGSMLWTFGIVSLNACRTKLCAYPKVCSMIAQHDNFSKFPQNLKDFVLSGIKGEQPPQCSDTGRATPPVWTQPQRNTSGDGNKSIPGSQPNRTVFITGNSVLSYTNVDTLVTATEKEGAEVAQPAETIVDKVLVLIAEHGEPFVRWLAQYVVMKRVSIEQNFLPLYNHFVQAIDHPLLDIHIKKETFRNIRELDLKSLLMEAYYKGQQELLFVVPFIAKILFSCSKTQIFSATCAWIRSILKILAELHNEPDLKINLKFEIEVLCKELSVDLHSLPLEGVLKDTDRLIRVPQQLSDLKLLARPEAQLSCSPVPSQMRAIPETVAAPGSDTKPSTPVPEGETTVTFTDNATNATHFAYHDINVISYDGLVPHLKIQATLPLFQMHPQIKHHVRPALTLAIKELIGPVAERALKIAMTVTENMIRKDFALDPDEKNMKIAAFHMMRAMTAGMAMITCRDPLASTMIAYLQQSFSNSLRTSASNPDQAKMIEEAAKTITHDNVELTTNFIVKTACEKVGGIMAASEMEKRLEPEYARRIASRRDNTDGWHDALSEKIQGELPAKIAILPGPTRKEHLAIYEQFSSRICGFKPTVADEIITEGGRPMQLPESAKEVEQLTAQLNHIIKEVDHTMQLQPNVNNKAFQGVGAIRDLLSQLAANPRDSMTVVNLITRSVEHLLHAFHVDPSSKPLDVEWARRLRDLFIGVCRVLLTQFTLPDLSRRITSCIVNIRLDYKWNVEAMEVNKKIALILINVLLKQTLVQTAVLDQHLAHVMDGGSNLEATVFAQRFIRAIGGGESSKLAVIKEAFPATYDQLVKIQQMQSAMRSAVPGDLGLDSPLGVVTSDPLGTARLEDGEMSDKVELILREWIGLCYTPMAQRNPQEALSQMILMMHEHGVLAGDDKITQFFRLCTEMCVDVSLRLLKTDTQSTFHQSTIVRQRCYYTLDAFVKLMSLMIKYSDGGNVAHAGNSKVNLLKKLLTIITNVTLLITLVALKFTYNFFRVLLVILHDFPELLCEYHYVICDTIPPNCVQLRNLVLSAYPRNMRLPDPFALNFKQVDGIPEMAVEPKSNLNMATIIPENIRLQLDDYLQTRSAVDFLSALPGLLQISQTPGSKYNTTVMNALVLYVGIRLVKLFIICVISTLYNSNISEQLRASMNVVSAFLFIQLLTQLSWTYSRIWLFSCARREQITRILFERLVALRPHPWGLLITFIELIKNPVYNFWKYEFTRCAPEIERLFQNVANTCVASRPTAAETKA